MGQSNITLCVFVFVHTPVPKVPFLKINVKINEINYEVVVGVCKFTDYDIDFHHYSVSNK